MTGIARLLPPRIKDFFRNDSAFAGRIAGLVSVRSENLKVVGRGRVEIGPDSQVFFKIKRYLANSTVSVRLVLDVAIDPKRQTGAPRIALDFGDGYRDEHVYELRRLDGPSLWGLHVPLPQFVRELRLDFAGSMLGPAEIRTLYAQRSDLRALIDHVLGLPTTEQRSLVSGKVVSALQALGQRRALIERDVAEQRSQGALAAAVCHGLLFNQAHSAPSTERYRAVTARFERLLDADRAHMRALAEAFPVKPFFSVVMPVYNPPVDLLEEAIRSLQAQTYPNWELCIADDASPDFTVRAAIQRMAEDDPRIRYVFRARNGHISEASNSAAALARGDYLVLMDNDDLIPAHALWTVAYYINQNPGCRLLFSDEDKINLEGYRAQPYLKGAFDRFLMYGHNMFSHLGVYERALFESVGGFRKGYEGSQDYDLTLRCIEHCADDQIVHIPHVLYQWRQILGSTSMGAGQKNYAFEAAKRAINSHFERMGYPLESVDSGVPGIAAVRTLPVPDPKTISVVVLTRNGLSVLKPCIESLRRVGDPLLEIVVVDNFSDDPDTLAYLDTLRRDRAGIVVVRSESEFNFSRLCNLGVAQARGEIICLLNNDTEVITTDLFQRARAWLSMPDVGMVGARLLFPNGTVQHFGVYTGVGPHGIAVHAHFHRPDGEHVQFSKSLLLQQFSAVTAACCFLRRADYLDLGGMDEDFAVAYNDVDLCLRVRRKGLKIVCDPGIKLVHKESVSRGRDIDPTRVSRLRREAEHMLAKWGEQGLRDPFYNPSFSVRTGDFDIAEFPRIPIPWKSPQTLPEFRAEAVPTSEVQVPVAGSAAEDG